MVLNVIPICPQSHGLSGERGEGGSKDHNVKIRPRTGCTIEDIENHIKPILRKGSEAIIIYSGTNDKSYPTKKEINKAVQLIDEASPDIQIIISGLISQEDRETSHEISSINNQLEAYWNSKKMFFVNNNIKTSYTSCTGLDYVDYINVTLKHLRHSLLNNIFSYLTINSIRKKFDDLDKVKEGNIDILGIEETKLDESFPHNQFILEGYHTAYWLD